MNLKRCSKDKFRIAVILALLVPLAGCGERAPVSAWSVNLDVNCNPQDPVDKLRAIVSGKKFWTEQLAQIDSILNTAEKSIRISEEFLFENQNGRANYRIQVQQRALELGYSGPRAQQMMAENMAKLDEQAEGYKTTIANLKTELAWARRCKGRVVSEMSNLGMVKL